MEWLCDNIVGIIAIIVAIVVGIIGRVRVKKLSEEVKSIKSAINTGTGSFQQAETINNHGMDNLAANKMKDEAVAKNTEEIEKQLADI